MTVSLLKPNIDDAIFWHDKAKVWWPKDDQDPKTAYEWIMKHLPDVDEVTKHCKQRRTVVQAGGHVGLWPLRLAKYFQRVLTFEVQPSSQECLTLNTVRTANINVYRIGLGDKEEIAPLKRSGSAGGWRIDPTGDRTTKLMTIDSLKLKECDAIVLDIEGFEVQALKGASETIQRCNPLLYVEELPRSTVAIKAYMKDLGYKEVKRVHRDVIYVRRNAI